MTEPTFSQRAIPHLIAMCDGKRHIFLDHEMAAELLSRRLIAALPNAEYVISEAGRRAVVNGELS
jgi:hypothetical protein